MKLNNPCTQDCPDRCGGCSISCPRWAAYVEVRNAEYERRKKEADRISSYYTAAQEQRHRRYLMKKPNRRSCDK